MAGGAAAAGAAGAAATTRSTATALSTPGPLRCFPIPLTVALWNVLMKRQYTIQPRFSRFFIPSGLQVRRQLCGSRAATLSHAASGKQLTQRSPNGALSRPAQSA